MGTELSHWVAVCVLVTLFAGHTTGQGALGNFRCITGHNYSSNWNYYTEISKARGWWYYDYKVDDSSPLKETSCGPGFDACKTEILVHTREAFDADQQSFVEFKSAEMILSCTYMDYCYPENEEYMYTDPNTLVYHNADPEVYTHQVNRIIECCNSEWTCNIDSTGAYSNKYAGASNAGVSIVAVTLAGLLCLFST
eukprot:INCI6951.1.p1 GENE.INCI6951.1~~INCI6951.1.p1  ORF type:complete len:196 (-),score=16.84 INCI6951.1:112-699(-)